MLDPQCALWDNYNNAEFEGGRQNMMGFSFSCMKVVYKYTSRIYYHCTRNSGVSLTRKPASH